MSRTDKRFTVDDAYAITDNGRRVFESILGNIKKPIKSPFRNDGNVASFNIFNKGGIWFYKDFGGVGDSGDCIKFLQLYYKISFKETLELIKKDYYIELSNNIRHIPKTISKETLLIDFEDMPFNKLGHKYWNEYELTEEFLKSKNIYQVKKYAIGGKVRKIPENQVVFAYDAFDINRVKLLTIGNNVERKWINNCPNTYLWYYTPYINNPCTNLFVAKSVKDSLVFSLLNRCTISTQNESAKTFLQYNVEKIKAISSNPIIVFGTDTQGKQESITITKETGFKWFNTANYLLKDDINDPAELVKVYGLKQLERVLKQKKL